MYHLSKEYFLNISYFQQIRKHFRPKHLEGHLSGLQVWLGLEHRASYSFFSGYNILLS